ncbi:MAG: DUF87 domain-containing protein [Ignavibacteria bacterium]|nr:DUF87 domain-containing protein [Ignavibacteria bacterium]
MESDRKIGKIVSVNSYSATIELDKEAQSFVKNSFAGTHKIGIINSYIIIPIGSDKIVGIVTKVNMFEDAELNYKDSSAIILPKSKRTMTVTMIGSIVTKYKESVKEKETRFEYGVVGYPSLDNPVWSITEDELEIIFSSKTNADKKNIKIGKSTVFPDYSIALDIDNFFGKHAAVLGNTGSGKSCTITAIIRSVLEDKPEMKNAHFIIFDTNNEYENAFTIYNDDTKSKIKDTFFERLIIRNESDTPTGFYLPHWFMNSSDYYALFRPGEGAQGPVLFRAITAARGIENINQRVSHFSSDLNTGISVIKGVLDEPSTGSASYYNKKNINQQVEGIKKLIEKNNKMLTESKMEEFIASMISSLEKLTKLYGGADGNIDADYASKVRDVLDEIEVYIAQNLHKLTLASKYNYGIDTPQYFDFREFIVSTFPQYIDRYAQENDNRIRNYIGTLQLRLEQYFNDKRYGFIFKNEKFENSLAQFLRYILGENPFNNSDEISVPWAEYCKKQYEVLKFTNENKRHRITILDFSKISSDVLENVTALVGRLIFEFMQRIENRGSFPIVLVLEEAHHYIPEFTQTERQVRARQVFEKIAKEGRKFGLSLLIASQRPSELSKTIMAQCNSFIVHRIQNPEDQKYFRSVISSVSHDLLNQLPSLPQRSALVMGDCVTAPVQVTIRDVNPTPDSRDPKFSEIWSRENFQAPNFEDICKKWESGE